MNNSKNGFYKVIYNDNNLNSKQFIWIDYIDEDSFALSEYLILIKSEKGGRLELADKNDKDFQDYILFDLQKIKQEEEKLKILKERLLNNLI